MYKRKSCGGLFNIAQIQERRETPGD
jgi:hypothetical protein